jgi:phytanoyl-CoA hydroxylase
MASIEGFGSGRGSRMAEVKEKYSSKFGGLWFDRTDYEEIAEKKLASGEVTAQELSLISDFNANGFIIIKNAVPEDIIDSLNYDIEKIWQTQDSRFIVQTSHDGYKPIKEVRKDQILAKLLDVYAYSEAAKQASFCPKISRFLKIIFESDVRAFQNLTFEVGSTQSVHQDGAYVVVGSPLKFAASWIAREDIELGSGELVYFPGSHRFPAFEFSPGRMHWDPSQDGQDIHQEFLSFLYRAAAERSIQLEHFTPKKGDALIWHAGLAHGGAPITNPSLTRKSFVTHYSWFYDLAG